MAGFFKISSSGEVEEGNASELYPEKDECKNPECAYCSADGECIFETCQIEELPKVDESYKFYCILCNEDQEANPMSVQGRLRICDTCLEKLLETHQIESNFKCIICDERKAGSRRIFGVNICKECFDVLQGLIKGIRFPPAEG